MMTTSTRQLAFAAPAVPHPAGSTIQARVLLFNAQHAAPERARRQAAWIAGQENADLLVITEVGPSHGGTALEEALTDHGYTQIIAPQPSNPDYRTILASRTAPIEAMPSGVTHLPHRAPAATVTIGEHTIGLFGLYVPSRGPKERRNIAKRTFQDAVTAALPGLGTLFTGMPVIVTGDLNVIEPGHQPPHKVFGAWEYAFYDSFRTAGLTDAFRHLHPDPNAHSWYGRSGNGFRFDHIFVTTPHAHLITACAYHHQPREQGLTDHAAMTLRFDLPTAG
ncbi:endonuclease/exonuclease/phosphatase family protein [Actinacidiphila sp. ITFR-21]|uniref:endonuclease/exonuclease/phosphatase family protein n=1 Tax=Actinacidiphila sp. ITFR-21 TaxID=3075199 RepID=UPI00288B2464|nr:endonuclease/exonuclease/phosphatase family protein [Streptomyces sp. ITFR-21]WNI18051.1 endonuclease [Streptomyces sp. ITFR-21]